MQSNEEVWGPVWRSEELGRGLRSNEEKYAVLRSSKEVESGEGSPRQQQVRRRFKKQ